ncbi:MAG: hypothetical protein MUD04_10305 [Cyanobium sp. Prado107]|nr:hypothetical protein [Cyanobium sp. Prado107]
MSSTDVPMSPTLQTLISGSPAVDLRIRVSAKQAARIDALAASHSATRSAAVQALLQQALASLDVEQQHHASA